MKSRPLNKVGKTRRELAKATLGNKVENMYAADPKTEQEIRAFIKACEESFNANHAAAPATLCIEDVVQIGPEGAIYGRQAIEKKYARSTRSASAITFRGIPDFGAVRSEVRMVLFRLAVIVSTYWFVNAMAGSSAYHATT